MVDSLTRSLPWNVGTEATTTTTTELSVCILQLEAFEHDQAIREALQAQKYQIRRHQLVTLTRADAQYFVQEVCDPTSNLHRMLRQEQEELQRAAAAAASAAAVAINSTTPFGGQQSARKDDPANNTTTTTTNNNTTESARESTTLPPLLSTTAKPLASATPTPRSTVQTARSAVPGASTNNTPRTDALGSTRETERLEDVVDALSRGPIVVLVLQKDNAVKDLIELIGPSDASRWSLPAHSNCLRAKFAIDARRLALRSSRQLETVMQEIKFLCLTNHSSLTSNTLLTGDQVASGQQRKSTKVIEVEMHQLMNFLFPPHLQHPNSVGRLFVFALYGPLDHKSRLRSGEKGLHVVTDQELTTMCNRIERDDILAVYLLANLAQDEEEEVLRHVESRLKVVPRYTQRDILQLFEGLQRDAQGRTSFHEMQQVILQERVRRVLCMKQAIDPSLAAPLINKYRKALTRLSKTCYEIAPPSMFLKDIGMDDCDNSVLVSRLLSRFSFEICHLDDGNSPALTQNVQLTRQDILLPRCNNLLPWNGSTRLRK